MHNYIANRKKGAFMNEKPALDRNLDEEIFRSYYFLKEELVAFCRANGLPASGSKMELTERIADYLTTGEIKPAEKAKKTKTGVVQISEESLIEPDFVCSEKHRAFFKERIGNSFSFNVQFQKWLKVNTGKTYAEAIAAYHEILAEKKKGPAEIGRQFEYNSYIHAFFEDNPDKTLQQAIQCWNYKKSMSGSNSYERSDLSAL
ncbi:putative Cytosolic Protein [Candidatus Methanomassiliicoccus intestinalis Issoire-Mx1]|jgi:hypothetical protein|uniref:Putative Cytosolic Protein n=2 Tax=Candidatus Methanomassiliicoccus intestinalis TaxID=1406512 RepID=R9T4J2_METII|nr:putative Cytosolic Protein [Candidatus Methanomassiliicoccus intestinalis Issoire-Mx1]